MRAIFNARLTVSAYTIDIPALHMWMTWLPRERTIAASFETFRFGGCLAVAVPNRGTNQELPWRSPCEW